MADTTDPVSIKFCNEQLRPSMDRLAGALADGAILVQQYAAKGIGSRMGHPVGLLASQTPPDLTSVSGNVVDGAGTGADGRNPISNQDVAMTLWAVNYLLGLCGQSLTFGSGGPSASSAALAGKVCVNPRT